MPFYKKILILLIIIIFTYILYQLFIQRAELLRQKESMSNQKSESIFNTAVFGLPSYQYLKSFISSEEDEVAKLNKNADVKLLSLNAKAAELPLMQYIVKSSYNSAITGSYASLLMLKYVINRGCRCLDFEILYLDNSIPCVGYTTDSTYLSIDSNNTIPLSDIFKCIIANAFTCVNGTDPLYIHLRIKSNNDAVYEEVAKLVDIHLTPVRYDKPVNETTKLSDVMGKVIIMVDKTINPNYNDSNQNTCNGSPTTPCYLLKKYVNIESGSPFLRNYKYSFMLTKSSNPPQIMNNNTTTDVNNMHLVVPDSDTTSVSNPPIYPFISKYGSQIIMYKFYCNDDELENYEDFFSENSFAFVPMAKALTYLKSIEDE
jgi:hypothetical protein